jgi:diguanylate cyclase (GGDEF)-like protein
VTGAPPRPPAAGAVDTIDHLEELLRYDARTALARAVALLDAHGQGPESVGYQRMLLVKGGAQARLGATEDGARVIREVKTWAEARGETDLLARAHRGLSALFRRMGDPALMLEHAVSAVDLTGPDAPDAVRADRLLGLADALGASGSFTDSVHRYRAAAAVAEGCGDRYLQRTVLNNLAFTLYEAGRPEEAVATAEQLMREAERDGAPLQRHDGDTVARAYMAVGRYREAAEVLEPLVEAPDSGEDCDGLVMALLALAEVRRRAGSYGPAQEAIGQAARLAEEYALTGRSIDILREQAELYAAQGEYRQAFETFRDFHEADLDLRAVERDSRARTLNAIFEAAEARRSSDYFRELSVRDPLTGLHNRRHLDERLTELLADQAVGSARLAVGLVDLDHFKRINDTRSHAVGDEVLRRVAGLLREAAEQVEGGLAARLGGEEFLVLLPGVEGDEAARRLDALRHAVASYGWDEVTDGIPVTASIVMAEVPTDAKERGDLLATADRRLYRAKREGRDRVVARD